MSANRRLLAAVVLAWLLCACDRQAPATPAATVAEAEEVAHDDGIDRVTVAADAAFVGAAVDDAGRIPQPLDRFRVGDTVYLSLPGKDHRPGSEVEVFWFHEDGTSRKDEHKTLTSPHTVFTFQPRDPGSYNAEVDVDGHPVALVGFDVAEAAP